MRKIVFIYIVLLVVLTACKKAHYQPDDCSNYDYSDHVTDEPFVASAKFSFTINDKVKNVPFIIYEGNVEDGKAIFYDTAKGETEVNYYLNFGEYSIKAKYEINGKTTYVIDGGKMEKWSYTICDSICWDWDNLQLDLQLH